MGAKLANSNASKVSFHLGPLNDHITSYLKQIQIQPKTFLSVCGIFPHHFLFRASVLCRALCPHWFSPSHPRILLLTYLDPLLQLCPWRCFLQMIWCSDFGSVPQSSVVKVLLPSPVPVSLTQNGPAWCVPSWYGSVWGCDQCLSPLCVDWSQRMRKPKCSSELLHKVKKLQRVFNHLPFIHSFIHCPLCAGLWEHWG